MFISHSLSVLTQYPMVTGLTRSNSSTNHDDPIESDFNFESSEPTLSEMTHAIRDSERNFYQTSQGNGPQSLAWFYEFEDCDIRDHKNRDGCPYTYLQSGLSFCLLFNRSKKSWEDSKDHCKSHGYYSFLAEPFNKISCDLLYAVARNDTFWIGLKRIPTIEDGWSYLHHTTRLVTDRHDCFKDVLPDNYQGNQNCIMISKERKGGWDDNQCNKIYAHMCESVRHWGIFNTFDIQYEQEHPWEYPIVGDPFVIKIDVLTSLLRSLYITLYSERKKLMRYHIVKEYSNCSEVEKYSDYIEDTNQFHDIEIKHLKAGTNQDHLYCAGKVNATLKLLAQEFDEKAISYQLCIDFKAMETGFSNIESYKCETLEPEKPFSGSLEVTFIPTLREMNNISMITTYMNYTQAFKCLCRLGKDSDSNCTVSHYMQRIEDDREVYRLKASSWHQELSFKTRSGSVIKSIGEKVPGITVVVENAGKSVENGGHFMKIRISLGPEMYQLHKTRLGCRSNARPDKQDYRLPRPLFKQERITELIVKFPPGRSMLEVHWPGEPGEAWLGVPLTATCTSYVGSLFKRNAMEWHVQLPSKDQHLYWKNYLGEPNHKEGKYTNTNIPDRYFCEGSGKVIPELGTCVKVVNDVPLSWNDARRYCKKKFNYFLATIPSRETFLYLIKLIPDDGFFIDVNDREQEGQYKQRDGRPILKNFWHTLSKHEDSYSSDPEHRDCGALHPTGIRMYNCETRLPFICQSAIHQLVSPNNFDMKYGNFLKSTITFYPDGTHKDATLSCRSSPHNLALPKSYSHLTDEDLSSNTSQPIVLKRGQGVPTLKVDEQIVGESIFVYITCTAVVGDDGTMSLTLTDVGGTHQTWLVYGGKKVEALDSTKAIVVTENNNTENDEVGHKIVSTMSVALSPVYHLASITCYSYNINNPNTKITSYTSKSNLSVSHVIDIFNLESLGICEVEEVYERTYGRPVNLHKLMKGAQTPVNSPSHGSLLKTFFIFLFTILIIGVASMKKDVVSKTRHAMMKEDTETVVVTRYVVITEGGEEI